MQARAYPIWSMELLTDRDLTADVATDLLAQTRAGAEKSESYWQAVLKNIGALEKSLKSSGDNLRPQQARAAASIERLIDAAFVVVGREGLPDSNMQAIAAEANVSLTTAYRYFSSTDQVMGALVRRWQTRRLAAMAVRLAELRFASAGALAREIVDAVGDTYLQNDLVPLRIRRMALRDHHRIAYAELWDLALIVQETLGRSGLALGDRARIAMALAGLGAQAKMAALHAPEQLHSPSFRRDLTSVLMAALEGDDTV
jgi:AcrR family transcriptional regulator